MSDKPKNCFPACEFFRCGQRSLFFKGKVAWCKFADDECVVKTCKYVQCVRGKMLPDGICGLTVKAKSLDDIKPEEAIKPVKITGKLVQKLKEKELY